MIHYAQYLALDDEGNPIRDANNRLLYRDPRDCRPAISDFEANDENTVRISDDFLVMFKTWEWTGEPRCYLYEASVFDGNGVINIRVKSHDFAKLMADFLELALDPVRVSRLRSQAGEAEINTVAKAI